MEEIKKKVQEWWNSFPCCSKAAKAPRGTREFYEQVDLYKNTCEPFTNHIADYARWNGKEVLEIGCGLGKDFSRFASGGAAATAIDMSLESLKLTKKRLEIFGLKGNLCLADAENLPFKDNVFDLIFSWGVLHHTPNTQKATDEAYRSLKPKGGKIIIMLYNKYSLLSFTYSLISMFYLTGIDRKQMFAALTDGTGNPLSKAYSRKEALVMFLKFRNIRIRAYEPKETPFKKIFNIFDALEKRFGWFMVIRAEK